VLLAGIAVTGAARTRPHYGGTLQVEIQGDPWERPGGLARRLVFDGLMRFDANGALQPALAIEASSENGDRRWQFKLRPGVHFHDGSALTSVAVVAGLEADCAGNCPWTAVRALGSQVVFTSDTPMPYLPELLASDEFLIALTVSTTGNASPGTIGTGPFQVTGFANGVLTLTASDTCWQGRPFVDAIAIRTHRAVRDQWFDVSVDRADVVEAPAEQMRTAQQQRLAITSRPDAELLALEVSDTGALANANLRGAIALAIDRGALANVIFQKQGQVTASLLPQGASGYAFLFSTDRDLNKAHELKGGLTAPALTLRVEGDGAMELAAQRIALNLREAGFNVQVTGAGQAADLRLRRMALGGGEPAAMLEALARECGRGPIAASREPAAMYKAEREFLEQRTVVPLVDLPRAWATSGRVRGLRLLPGGAPDLANAWLEDGQ
jgi:MarR-like DNA-binding transcriptional regulator SgrR of sgrS sRNA